MLPKHAGVLGMRNIEFVRVSVSHVDSSQSVRVQQGQMAKLEESEHEGGEQATSVTALE